MAIEGGGAAHQEVALTGDAVEGEGGRPYGLKSSESKNKNLIFDYHVKERCTTEYWIDCITVRSDCPGRRRQGNPKTLDTPPR
jgi:hypothetical protein